jgi:cation:H+ antiporter
MLLNVALVIIGLVGLLYGGDSLVRGAARLASSLGVSPTVVGLTVVAFGTSVPELLVSLSAAARGSSDIALGNVLGSNIANVGLIIGVTALVYPLSVHWRLIRREIPLMIGVSILVFALALNGNLGQLDGLILFIGFFGFAALSYFLAREDRTQIEPGIAEYDENEGITPVARVNRRREVGRLVFGIILLGAGAQATVVGATEIALAAGVSEMLIGVTLVAFGTSLPELAASVMAALRRETDIAVGNVIGSNISNLLLILGATALVKPIGVEPAQLQFEFPAMIIFAVLVIPFALDRRLVRREGLIFLLLYMGFITATFLRT